MQRVYGLVDDELVHRIDEKAGEATVSRAQWIRMAIEAYLHRGGEQETIEAVNLCTALEERSQKIAVKDGELSKLRDELAVKGGELDQLKETGETTQRLKDLESELTQLKIDAEQKWRETSQLRSEISQSRRELESLRTKADHLQAELDKKRAETEQAHGEAETLKLAQAHFQETFKLRDQHISFLEGHLSQLTEKIQARLPPSEEEAKKKGWWQFWK